MPPALMPAIILASGAVTAGGIVAGTSIYTSEKQAKTEKKLQEEALAFQTAQVSAAEAKVAGAEALATQTAADKKRKQRLAQTQTILTSPLGIQSGADTSRPTLLGS